MFHLKPNATRFLIAACLAAIVAAIGNRGAQAALITTNYGDFIGATRDYLGVTEASEFGNPGPFGTPHIDLINAPNTLLFDNTNNFISQSIGPAFGIDGLDSRLVFTISAHTGSSIDTIFFAESGVFSLSTTSPAIQAEASVGNQVFFRISEVDDLPYAGNTVIAPPMTFTPTNVFNTTDLGNVTNGTWQGSLFLDLAAQFPTLAGRITAVEIALDNSVNTINLAGATASIEKKSFRVTVPELSASLLASAGALFAAGLRISRLRASHGASG